MVYPSPFNPDRYLVCYAATSPVGYYFMDRVWPEVDFCVVDGRPGQAVAQGFFDNAWRFRMSNTELRDAAAWRATTAKGPTRATAAGNDPVLWLSDLMEVGAEGAFRTVRRDVAPGGASLVVANRTFAHGLAVTLERGGGTMTYDLAGATYTRAKAVLGIAVQMGPQVTDAMRRETRVYYRVLADGKEVFKSRLMLYEDAGKVVDLDVSVEGVRTLVLEVRNDASGANAAAYAALADLRLEK
jgi:hypothetical protein